MKKNNYSILASKFNQAKNQLTQITIFISETKKQNKRILAREATWHSDQWEFSNLIIYNLDRNGDVLGEPIKIDTVIINIPERIEDFIDLNKTRDIVITKNLSYTQIQRLLENIQ